MSRSSSASYSPLALPSLRKAARMLNISASTLSRRGVPHEQIGAQKRLRPSVVLSEASYHGRRPLDEVGEELIEFAKREAPEAAAAVEAEVDAFFDSYVPAPVDADSWLADAKKFLPAEVYEQVRGAIAGNPAEAKTPDRGSEDVDRPAEQRGVLAYSSSSR